MAVTACRVTGVEAVARRRMRNNLLVLCYHGVVSQPRIDRFGYEDSVGADEFRGQIEFLAQNFRPVNAAAVIAARNLGRPLPPNAMLVTFDDGYRNNLTIASGILRSAGVPALFFLTTGYIEGKRILWPVELIRMLMALNGVVRLPTGEEIALSSEPHERRRQAKTIRNLCKTLPAAHVERWLAELRTRAIVQLDEELDAFLTWDEVRELAVEGFEIGAHTKEHPILTRVPAERLHSELRESKQKIENELGRECATLAYPNGGAGDVSAAVFNAAREAGYQLGFTLAERTSNASEDSMAISRVCVQGHLPLSFFRFQMSGVKSLLSAA